MKGSTSDINFFFAEVITIAKLREKKKHINSNKILVTDMFCFPFYNIVLCICNTYTDIFLDLLSQRVKISEVIKKKTNSRFKSFTNIKIYQYFSSQPVLHYLQVVLFTKI